MAEIDGEQYAARKLGCEISADPLNPLDPIKKVCKSHHPDEDLSILDRAYRRAVIQHSAQRRKSGEPYIIHPLAVSQIDVYKRQLLAYKHPTGVFALRLGPSEGA